MWRIKVSKKYVLFNFEKSFTGRHSQKTLIIILPTLLVIAICQCYLPTLSANAICQHYLPTPFANTISHRYPTTLFANAICQSYLPKLSVNAICQRYLPTLSVIAMWQHCLPTLSSEAICQSFLLKLFAKAICQSCLPKLFAKAICQSYLSKLFACVGDIPAESNRSITGGETVSHCTMQPCWRQTLAAFEPGWCCCAEGHDGKVLYCFTWSCPVVSTGWQELTEGMSLQYGFHLQS